MTFDEHRNYAVNGKLNNYHPRISHYSPSSKLLASYFQQLGHCYWQ
ncbi:hypothetical protein ACN23B_25340 [Anabaena sp. FACHB-709]|uniref:Uncharacterized protein n=1 Tax=Anabaena cylindrica FACHB-318 TaxID=2692880 RepID=A0ABR7ZJC9_ANACY|nr:MULTISPECIES: hypothetical protein [Nostocaceae]MBD2172619.1 hypothetical protein [Anabaena cylindrica FACHB-318]MBD2284669.1 hypothetical protein [Anabaena cylindrica FACHB-170]